MSSLTDSMSSRASGSDGVRAGAWPLLLGASVALACGGQSSPVDRDGAQGSPGGNDGGYASKSSAGGGGTEPDDSGAPLVTGGGAGLDGAGATSGAEVGGVSGSGGPSDAGAAGSGGAAGTPGDAGALCTDACRKLEELECEGSDRRSCEEACMGGQLEDACRVAVQEVYGCAAAAYPDSVRCVASSGVEFVCGWCDEVLAALAANCHQPLRCVF